MPDEKKSLARCVLAGVRRCLRPTDSQWAVLFLVPYALTFVLFVAYPIVFAFTVGAKPANFAKLWADPIFLRTLVNTGVFLALAINLKLLIALFLSGLFVAEQKWVRWLSAIFILPWAIPSLATILSFRWMLNAEWGMLNNFIFTFFHTIGPGWLLDPQSAFGAIVLVHIWKYLPFWTIVMIAGRLAIPKEIYESAAIDGVNRWQQFRYVTFPSLRDLYLTSTLLAAIWGLGDFNSVYLLTGGGPGDRTHVLATLGIRYAFGMGDIGMGIATAMAALPFLVPLVVFLAIRLRAQEEAA